MERWHAAALGVEQGRTKFLPVSSPWHMVLWQQLLGFHEPALMCDIAVHVGNMGIILGIGRSIPALRTRKRLNIENKVSYGAVGEGNCKQ